jgi:hypothetical protein
MTRCNWTKNGGSVSGANRDVCESPLQGTHLGPVRGACFKFKFPRSSLAMIAGALGMVTEVAGGHWQWRPWYIPAQARTGTLARRPARDRDARARAAGVSEGRPT